MTIQLYKSDQEIYTVTHSYANEECVSYSIADPNRPEMACSLSYLIPFDRLFIDYSDDRNPYTINAIYDRGESGQLELSSMAAERNDTDFSKREILLDVEKNLPIDTYILRTNTGMCHAVERFLDNPALSGFLADLRWNAEVAPGVVIDQKNLASVVSERMTQIREQGYSLQVDKYGKTYHILPEADKDALYIRIQENEKHQKKSLEAYRTYDHDKNYIGNNGRIVIESYDFRDGSHYQKVALYGAFGSIDATEGNETNIDDASILPQAYAFLQDERLQKLLQNLGYGDDVAALTQAVTPIAALPVAEADETYHRYRNYNRAALDLPQDEQNALRELDPEALFEQNKNVFQAGGVDPIKLWSFFDDKYGADRPVPAVFDASQSENGVSILIKTMANEDQPWVQLNSGILPVLVRSGLAMTRQSDDSEPEYTITPDAFIRYKKWVGFNNIL